MCGKREKQGPFYTVPVSDKEPEKFPYSSSLQNLRVESGESGENQDQA